MQERTRGEFCSGRINHMPVGTRWILLCAPFLLLGFAVSCREQVADKKEAGAKKEAEAQRLADAGKKAEAGNAAGGTAALSKEQIEKLVPLIKENTPENTHFSRNTKFEWVLLKLSGKNPKEVDDAVTTSFRQAYPAVYLTEKEIPENRQVRGPNNTVVGYDKGFRFSFEIKMPERDIVEIRYWDWEGNLAGSGRTITYKWDGGKWVGTRTGPEMVS
jgi:hypothetical protein